MYNAETAKLVTENLAHDCVEDSAKNLVSFTYPQVFNKPDTEAQRRLERLTGYMLKYSRESAVEPEQTAHFMRLLMSHVSPTKCKSLLNLPDASDVAQLQQDFVLLNSCLLVIDKNKAVTGPGSQVEMLPSDIGGAAQIRIRNAQIWQGLFCSAASGSTAINYLAQDPALAEQEAYAIFEASKELKK